uniref:Nucleotid_trans domain-containing protein n=1 Tax=Panagrellus redivivus TaxID=6233 RepID=A0A7E4URF6_PANRE
MPRGLCRRTHLNCERFVVVCTRTTNANHYRVAQQSLECYLKGTNYTFKLVDLDTDERVAKNCKHDQLFFKKHCAASVYLEDADWMLVLDADTGIVNPNHCIEEWIDDRVDLVFYERYFNWEIASGNYLVRNTPFARDFLRRWADWQYTQPSNWNGADNGVLQMHLLTTVNPGATAEIKACDAIWHKGKDYDTYMAFVTCVKVMLGAQRLWPGKVRVYRRAHGWVRDGYLTSDGWSEHDFMLHGWKAQEIGQSGWSSPFTKLFNVSECGSNFVGWNWRSEKRVPVENIRNMLAAFEKSAANTFPKMAQVLPYFAQPDVGECYPHCDSNT